MIRAVFFDFGGVVTTSPFDAFASYEQRSGLPEGFIRRINATNPDTNAWARLERSEISLARFVEEFEAEAEAAGHRLDGSEVLACLSGELRPAMLTAIRRCREHVSVACLTNNIAAVGRSPDGRSALHDVVDELFDVVLESSKLGVRKPDRAFYEIACATVGVQPDEVVFLDDLGINLKPARQMGMTTIKVTDEGRAVAALEAIVGFPLG